MGADGRCGRGDRGTSGACVGRADGSRRPRRAPRDRRHGERDHEREARVRRWGRGPERDRLLDGDDVAAGGCREREVTHRGRARRWDRPGRHRDRDRGGARRRDGGPDRPASPRAARRLDGDRGAAGPRRRRRGGPDDGGGVEDPLDLVGAVERAGGATIVDCLTLWASNQFGHDLADEEILEAAAAAAKACAARPEPTIVISNEVGSGIVPMHPLARRYRDVLGRINATFADAADVVALMVAGRAVRLSTMLTDLEEP